MPGMREGKPIEPKIWMAVLYQPRTGQIAHCHRVLQFDPQAKIDTSHVEARAREMAARHGWDVSKLEALHVDFSQLKRGSRYKVHPKTRTLVELPAGRRPKPPGHPRKKA